MESTSHFMPSGRYRVKLLSTLSPGGYTSAKVVVWDNVASVWQFITSQQYVTVYDPDYCNFGLASEYFHVAYTDDAGRYEIVGSKGLSRKAKVTEAGGIAVEGSGAVTVVVNDALSTVTRTAWLNWDHNDTIARLGDEVWIEYVRDEDKWIIRRDRGKIVALWRFQLNSSFSGTPSTADADLLELDGADTERDVTIYDYLDVFSADLTTGDVGYCIQQGDIYVAIQAPCPPEA
jgi:hypothetical protein